MEVIRGERLLAAIVHLLWIGETDIRRNVRNTIGEVEAEEERPEQEGAEQEENEEEAEVEEEVGEEWERRRISVPWP